MGFTLAEMGKRMSSAEFSLHLQLEIQRQPQQQSETLTAFIAG